MYTIKTASDEQNKKILKLKELFNQKIGYALMAIRKNRSSLSQESLSYLMHTTANRLRAIEKGKGTITAYEISQFCKHTNITPNLLFAYAEAVITTSEEDEPTSVAVSPNAINKIELENELITGYRNLSVENQQRVVDIIKALNTDKTVSITIQTKY